jgi:hypothetical protein
MASSDSNFLSDTSLLCKSVYLFIEYTIMQQLLFFFLNRRYNPWWVLACFTISFHSLLSLHFSLQFLTFIFFKSSSTWSSHLSLGLPTGLHEHGSHSVTFLTFLVVSILIICAALRNFCDLIIRFYVIIPNSIKPIITYATHPLTRTSFSLQPNIFRSHVSLIYKTHMLFSCKSLHAYVTD